MALGEDSWSSVGSCEATRRAQQHTALTEAVGQQGGHGPWTQQLKARLANACLSRPVGVLGRSGWMCSWSTGLASGESGGMEAGRDGTREAHRLQPSERTLSNSAVFVNLCLNPLRPFSCPLCYPFTHPHSKRQYLRSQHFLEPGDGQ